MNEWTLKAPVALLIFNRPDTTERVFAEIARVKPTKLLIVADGPRANRSGEAEKCAATRAIINKVNWNCEVLTQFADVNMGCKSRVSSGLDWIFSTVEEAIILEDDCFPHPSFFRFCDELLDRYRHDTRIAQISGVNFQFGERRSDDSYYFSRHNQIWGWASWRRAWSFYDVHMKTWPEIRSGKWTADIFAENKYTAYWTRILDMVYRGEIDTWDYQWAFACWVNSMLMVVPTRNLISNIGFGNEATHTADKANRLANLPLQEIVFPLRHPLFVIPDSVADQRIQNGLPAYSSWDALRSGIRRTLATLVRK